MKVAFATQDLATLDAHFGWCPGLLVLEVTRDGVRELARHVFPQGREDGDEDKLAPRLGALAGCTVLCAAAIGPGAQARAKAMGVHVQRAPEGTAIAALADKLRIVLAGTPPPWLRRALDRDAGRAPMEVEP
jgi:nitrogen fixation protein NifX